MASRQVLFVSALMAVVCRLQGQQDVSAGVATLIGMVQNLQVQVNTLQNAMSGASGACGSALPRAKPVDCKDILDGGQNTSGIYDVYPVQFQNTGGIKVYCDMDDEEGGWTIIQKRFDGSENFFRSWKDYEAGFGNKTGEHYIGNE